MKKILYLLLVLAVLWLAKLSYDAFSVSNQLSELQNTLHIAEQKSANLNDQLIALQRQPNPSNPQSNQGYKPESPDALKEHSTTTLAPTLLLKQKLELIQFALQQQQFVYALEQLQQLDQSIEQYTLADAVKNTLHHAITEDQGVIQRFVLARNTQQDQLDDVLSQLDIALQHEQTNQVLNVASEKKAYFWQKWLKIERVEQQSSELVNRKFILKEAQLRILLAQQALAKGQYLEYKNMLDLVLLELGHLPDQKSQKLKIAVEKLKHTQMIPVPKLSSSAILE